jgi:hypothetical protein
MKNRLGYYALLMVWLIPVLACSLGQSAAAQATATPIKPKATATQRPKATATTRATVVEPTATDEATVASSGEFGPVTFAAGVQDDEFAVDESDTFPDGMTLVYAVFEFSGMTDGETWRTEWLLDGEAQSNLIQEDTWSGGDSGNWWVSIFNDKGVTAGEWTLDLYIGDTLQQSATMTIEPNPSGEPDFGPIQFALGVDDQDAPVDPIDISNPTLPDGTPTIYAFFNGVDVPAGTTWTSAWFLNGESASDPKDHTWDFAPNEGNWISFGTNDDSPMDSGTYQLKLTIDGRLVNMATFIMP